MSVREKWITAEELLHMPDDGSRYELVEGELRKMTSAGSEHGYVALSFGSVLRVSELTGTVGATPQRQVSSPPQTRTPCAPRV